MYSFLHLHLKYTKSAIMTQKKIFLKNINMGIKKTQNFHADFKFACQLSKYPLKVKSKKPRKICKNEITQNLNSFLAIAFFTAFV
jgi:hypothetical protein